MIGLFLVAAAALGEGEVLLSCDGGTLAAGSTAATYSDNTGYQAYGSASSSEPTYVPFHVELRILDGGAKMSVPSSAVSGAKGDANWFPVSNLILSDAEIQRVTRYA